MNTHFFLLTTNKRNKIFYDQFLYTLITLQCYSILSNNIILNILLLLFFFIFNLIDVIEKLIILFIIYIILYSIQLRKKIPVDIFFDDDGDEFERREPSLSVY
jgi:hypothetical protein